MPPNTFTNRPSSSGCRSIGRRKEQIAREAMRQIKPHQTIFLDGSTTCLVLARHVAQEDCGLDRSDALGIGLHGVRAGHGENTVFSLGGNSIRPPLVSSVRRRRRPPAGSSSTSPFFSTKGFLPEEGTFESSIATIRIKQIVARAGGARGAAGRPLEVRSASPVQGIGHPANPRGDHRCGHGGGRRGHCWSSAA